LAAALIEPRIGDRLDQGDALQAHAGQAAATQDQGGAQIAFGGHRNLITKPQADRDLDGKPRYVITLHNRTRPPAQGPERSDAEPPAADQDQGRLTMLEIAWLTARLAGITTILLLILATPLAWWLARGRSRWKTPVGALVALPIVLPPTALGFYLLIALGPQSPLVALLHPFGVRTLAFTFQGLVIGSLIYSLPFAVQPLRNAFIAVGDEPLEAAATLGASPWAAFVRVALPLALPGYAVAALLVFAHTVGEFGVVMMLGGGIPGQTEVLSIEIYRLVEALEWDKAHQLAGALLVFAFLVMLSLLLMERRVDTRASRS
jgi:molybdate transport system permease protein